MINTEQFVYTSASIKNKKGYQIVAKSDGITDKIISKLQSYVYPTNIDPSKFQESRSLVLFNNDLIAYSRIKNIGLGYDGRENTLYNHTFIFSKKDFKECDNDSRIFDDFYLEDKYIRGILPTLSINPSSQLFPLITCNLKLILERILVSLFRNKKIALLINDVELPQKILSFLPVSMRLIPFSTFVIEPKKQQKYNLILNPKLNKSKLKGFDVISLDKNIVFQKKTSYRKSISYYAQLITSFKPKKLIEFHNSFEEIPGKSNKNKLILLSNYFQFQSANNNEEREEYAENVLESIKLFDQNTLSDYFKEIIDSVEPYKKLENKLQSELNPSMSFMENLFLLYAKTMIDIHKAFMDKQKEIKITSPEQLNNVPENDFVLITKLRNPIHVQKDARIHRTTCYTLKTVKSRKSIPTNNNYYHIESRDEETLSKYKNNMCQKCFKKDQLNFKNQNSSE